MHWRRALDKMYLKYCETDFLEAASIWLVGIMNSDLQRLEDLLEAQYYFFCGIVGWCPIFNARSNG